MSAPNPFSQPYKRLAQFVEIGAFQLDRSSHLEYHMPDKATLSVLLSTLLFDHRLHVMNDDSSTKLAKTNGGHGLNCILVDLIRGRAKGKRR